MPRKARRRSWGSITEVTRGKKYVIRWMENTDKGRRRSSKTFYGTYKDACRELSVAEVNHGLEKRTPTIGEVYNAWYLPWLELQVESGKKKQGTADEYISIWNRIVSPRWESTPIDKVKPAELQSWLLGLNKGNANLSMILLRKVGDLAVRNKVVDANVFRLEYDMPLATSRKKNLSVYNLSKAEEMFERLKGSNVEVQFIVSCFGGARVGESLGIRASEVRAIECEGIRFAVVPIKRRMTKVGTMPRPDGDLKTPQSERETLIPEPYCDRVLEIAKERVENGIEWLADRGDGLPMNANSFMYFFYQLAGPDSIPLSNLRASWRTIGQFDWGVDSDTLEVLMGHVLDGVSGKHYIRPSIMNIADSFAKAYKDSEGYAACKKR